MMGYSLSETNIIMNKIPESKCLINQNSTLNLVSGFYGITIKFQYFSVPSVRFPYLVRSPVCSFFAIKKVKIMFFRIMAFEKLGTIWSAETGRGAITQE